MGTPNMRKTEVWYSGTLWVKNYFDTTCLLSCVHHKVYRWCIQSAILEETHISILTATSSYASMRSNPEYTKHWHIEQKIYKTLAHKLKRVVHLVLHLGTM